MEDNVINLLKDRPFIIPKILINNYIKLNITEEELVIVMVIMYLGGDILYDPDIFVKELKLEKHKTMKLITSLINKNIISLEMVKNDRKTEEHITLSILYDKLMNIVKDVEEEDVTIDSSIFTVFEKELGRMLSPMQIQKIQEWIETYKNEELILAALSEAVMNNANNLNYIDAILNEWNKKGYKTKEDVMKDKNRYRKHKKEVDIVELDWLDD